MLCIPLTLTSSEYPAEMEWAETQIKDAGTGWV